MNFTKSIFETKETNK